ncbi:hypothetical protein B0T22DRAFT_458139 [Podospora appendiculata]|uniref:Uncharacterized protein n=1 Tax=Podospora appendiculata TaxID=314037 RepID=A0AAE1CBW2_9PEZI|nr:hypothetical protein B0T22DRAFT_458139 [Podospora appendiculata]
MLRLGWVSWHTFDTMEETAYPLTGAIQPLCTSLLTHVDLFIASGCPPYDVRAIMACRESMEMGALRRVLASLTRLQRLLLAFDFRRPIIDMQQRPDLLYPVTLADIAERGQTWPALEQLVLSNVECEGPDLVTLVENHRTSLKRVQLVGLRLNTMSWRTLLPCIKRVNADLAHSGGTQVMGKCLGRDQHTGGKEWWAFTRELNRDPYIGQHTINYPPDEALEPPPTFFFVELCVRSYMREFGWWERRWLDESGDPCAPSVGEFADLDVN